MKKYILHLLCVFVAICVSSGIDSAPAKMQIPFQEPKPCHTFLWKNFYGIMEIIP
jgi:hypothetical protein